MLVTENSCSTSADNFITAIDDAYKHHFPLISSTLQSNDKPWLTSNLKRLIKQRQQAYKKNNMMLWRLLRNEVQRAIRAAKQEFYRNTVQRLKSSQPGKWHKQIQKLCQFKALTAKIPGADLDPVSTVERINNHFADICNQLPALQLQSLPSYLPAESTSPMIYTGQVFKALRELKPSKAGHPSDLPVRLIREFANELASPLCHLYNACIDEGVFPSCWKTATVVPIPKEKNITSYDQLRPISLTPIFARVFETFLVNWIHDDIASQLNSNQYGNVKGSSTVHYLVDMLNFIHEGLDKPGFYANLCTVDFTKAFDRVDHSIVIRKLIDLGVRRSILPIICSFLTERTINTKLNVHLSSVQDISCGVPQGTKLGPILFLVLVDDVAVGGCRSWKYVDDLMMGEIVKQGQTSVMQASLDDLSKWCSDNNVLPKPSKCYTMAINFARGANTQSSFNINTVSLNNVTSVKLLGVTVQHNLKWDIHIADIVAKASRRLYTLCILKKTCAPVSDLIAVYTCYIRPILEYASPVWHSSISDKQSRAIESVQKRAVRIITGHRYDSYTYVLSTLDIPTLESRRSELLIKFGDKLLGSTRFRGMLPPDRVSVCSRNLRSTTTAGLQIPKCRTDRYRRSTIPALTYILK